MEDAISPVLRLIGVQSAVYFQREFSAPWGMDVRDTGFAQFHLIVQGKAVLIDDANNSIELGTGDIVVYPTGAAHRICDCVDTEAEPGQKVVQAIMTGTQAFAGDGVATRLICGHFDFDLATRHPLLAELPERILLKASDVFGHQLLGTLLSVLISESNSAELGSSVVAEKLADAIFVAILRTYAVQSANVTRFLTALKDPRLARCVALIHQSFPNAPSLYELAQVAGMSRSSTAFHFRRAFGFAPGAYATKWRLLQAAKRLRSSDDNIETVASYCGYESPASFSRAFRNLHGQSASNYRKAAR
ncbi:AraC family transcriptional regulator [Marivita sp.]|jgi:AraC-like DNA-binding protein|uniref:AraC family transcriptional regulator n=1 Tax=Roseobacteraceae TaxID=2854170 RepID=UPI003218E705